MEGAEDIYVNSGLTPKKRAKKETTADAQRFRKEDESAYENVSVTTKNRNGALEQQSMSIQWAPGASAPSNSSGISLVHKSVPCLYFLLALNLLLCIILMSLVLVKASEFSGELMNMKRELWNVSRDLQKEQDNVQKLATKITTIDNMVKNFVIDLSKKGQMLGHLSTEVKKLQQARKSGPSPTSSTSTG